MRLYEIYISYQLGPRSTHSKVLVVMAKDTEVAYVEARAYCIDILRFKPSDFSVVKVIRIEGNVLVARA
jgi:hypothetical protein